MVLDGNLKNRRDVCLAKDAGYIEYPGLTGRIKTGCMATPAFKSRYCTQHTDRVCTSSEGNAAQDNTLLTPGDQSVVEMLLEKKMTRTTTYYKVQLYIDVHH